jgi:hypothetical protein
MESKDFIKVREANKKKKLGREKLEKEPVLTVGEVLVTVNGTVKEILDWKRCQVP